MSNCFSPEGLGKIERPRVWFTSATRNRRDEAFWKITCAKKSSLYALNWSCASHYYDMCRCRLFGDFTWATGAIPLTSKCCSRAKGLKYVDSTWPPYAVKFPCATAAKSLAEELSWDARTEWSNRSVMCEPAPKLDRCMLQVYDSRVDIWQV